MPSIVNLRVRNKRICRKESYVLESCSLLYIQCAIDGPRCKCDICPGSKVETTLWRGRNAVLLAVVAPFTKLTKNFSNKRFSWLECRWLIRVFSPSRWMPRTPWEWSGVRMFLTFLHAYIPHIAPVSRRGVVQRGAWTFFHPACNRWWGNCAIVRRKTKA